MQIRVLLLAWCASGVAGAGEWDPTGFVGIESQVFWLDGRFPQQDDNFNASLLLQPEFYWRSDDDRQRVSIVAFARLESSDDERTHADLREAFWGIEGSDWDFTAGIGKVFWGVAESRHLVDVINQTDLVEDIDQEDKLGQPLLNFNLQRDYGRFEFFVMPWFRERTFPGPEGRFRTPLPVDTDDAIYESGDEERHVDLAFRYSHFFGDVDLGAYLFEGTSREPRLILAPQGNRLLPVYEQMTQLGVELQYTSDAWLWKLEAIGRDTRSDSFFAAVGGFEYTYYGIRETAVDIGLLLEYLYDDRNDLSPPTAFDNDVFLGSRLALNDPSDTAVLAGIAVDLDTQELFFNIEAERRFGDRLTAELRLRAFMNADPGDALFTIEHDDYLQLRLSWYY